MNGQDPDNHNGRCCWQPSRPLYKIIGKWNGPSCSYQCKQCTTEGRDTFRYCGSGCGGCYRDGAEYIPCCPGLEEVNEDSKFVCRPSQSSSCSSHPNCNGLAGNCCPTDEGVVLTCC